MITIQTIGHTVLAAKMKAAIPAAEAGCSQALARSLLIVQRRAMIKAPVDTGILRATIGCDMVDATEGTVTSYVDYSIYNEFGTCKMPAHPYMRPALDESVDDITKLIGEAVIAACEGSIMGGSTASWGAITASMNPTGRYRQSKV